MNCLQCIKFENSDTENTLTEKESEKQTEKQTEKESEKQTEQNCSKKLIDTAFEMDIVIIEPEHKQVLESPIICNEMYITHFEHKK
jgi:hypothetical protein